MPRHIEPKKRISKKQSKPVKRTEDEESILREEKRSMRSQKNTVIRTSDFKERTEYNLSQGKNKVEIKELRMLW